MVCRRLIDGEIAGLTMMGSRTTGGPSYGAARFDASMVRRRGLVAAPEETGR
jgi:hypothetical protein